jgi:NAD(P)-dependent dehydrogenase (short-subunit alcohol dehydrogenase family)
VQHVHTQTTLVYTKRRVCFTGEVKTSQSGVDIVKLDGKVALVTGGASGIGKATAKLFVKEGARIIISDIQDDKGRKLADELGPNAMYLHADVSQEADVRSAVQTAVGEYGRLDCIFNNAGIGGVQGPIESIPVEGFDQTIGVILRGVFLGMKHAAPIMKKQGFGSIVNNASVAGLTTGGGAHIYSAAKAAVIHLTRSVATELAESGVRVNCICPGGIITPIWTGGQDMSDETIERLKPIFARILPLRRAGLPEDVAKAVLWLASEDSAFVTGHALAIDAGLSVGRTWSEFQGALTWILSAMQGAPS